MVTLQFIVSCSVDEIYRCRQGLDGKQKMSSQFKRDSHVIFYLSIDTLFHLLKQLKIIFASTMRVYVLM